MTELPFEYWNKLANQFILTSSLLGGFSIATIANLIVSKAEGRIFNAIMKFAIVACSAFIATIFSMTEILMITTEGYPFQANNQDIVLPRIIGSLSFFLGIFGLIAMISLSGWTRSKKLGGFTTFVGVLTLILLIILMS